MKGLFGTVGLLIVLALVGLLVKKQMSSVNEIKLPSVPAAEATSPLTPALTPSGNVQQQSQQIQQQFKAAADAAVQQARPMPDDK
jgi:hypothetical protein